MDAFAMVNGLEQFAGRGAGTDAERRAASWLAAQISSGGRDATLETFWCRPNWALAHLWHVALAIAGSLLALASPIAGIALLAIALLSVLADELTGLSLGRRLTPERASQNVVGGPTQETAPPVRLILTANYDAGRVGLAYRAPLRAAAAWLKRIVRGVTPGWLGWLVTAILWLLAVAVLRLLGHKSHAIGVIQLPPTVFLVLAFALLLELASGDWSPSAGDNATGVAAVLALAYALDAAPPRNLGVEVVLTGAGDRDQLGFRRYLRARRGQRRPENTAVLGIAASGEGRLHWWRSDGPLVPLRYTRQLRQLAASVAAEESHLAAEPYQGRGSSPAYRGRATGLPAISVGCLDARGLPPRSHQRGDVASALDHAPLDRTVQFALLLIDQLDAAVGQRAGRRSATPA